MIQAFSFIGTHLPLGKVNGQLSEAKLLRGSAMLGKIPRHPQSGQRSGTSASLVITGLVPVIPIILGAAFLSIGMAGTSPAMT
jgi:hypothetical protein